MGSFQSITPPAADPTAAGDEKKKDEPRAYLPTTVRSSIYGDIPYAEFKKIYESIWDQVAAKDYLLRGRVVFECALAGTKFRLRSLTRREAQLMAAWEPSSVPESAAPEKAHDHHGIFVARLERNNTWRLALQLSGSVIGNQEISTTELTSQNVETWATEAKNRGVIEFVQNLESALFGALCDIIYDMSTANRMALLENARNPFRPHSPTTA